MAQVSRHHMPKSVQKNIIESFWWLIGHLSAKDEVDTFLNEFLTETEKIMLSKRLAIALMIQNGYTFEQIRDTLKVSTSTVLRISHWIQKSGAGYQVALKKLAQKEHSELFWKEIENLLELIGKGKRVRPYSK
jgi:uncharacterized protein YerC